MLLRSFFVALCVLCAQTARSTGADDAAATATPSGAISQGKHEREATSLVIDASGSDQQTKQQLQRDAARMVDLCCELREFHCRISPEFLQHALGSAIAFEAPFKDVLLNLPVTGQAHVAGQVRIELLPDDTQVVFVMCLNGQIEMRGIGRARGIRIHYGATSAYRATKRIALDPAGLSALPAACTADSSVTVTDVTTARPKIVGKFVERAARSQVDVNEEEAEAECSEHVEAAVCRALDCEVATLAKIVNAAVAERIGASSATQKEGWHQFHFRTEADSIHIARHAAQSALAKWPAADGRQPPATIRILRARLDLGGILALCRTVANQVGSKDNPPTPDQRLHATDAPPTRSIFGRTNAIAMRPAMTLEPDELVIVFDYPDQGRIARAIAGGP